MKVDPKSLVAVVFLAPGAKADTAAATSTRLDCSKYKGELVFILGVGTVTAGSITWTFTQSTDAAGVGEIALVANEGVVTAVTTSNDPLTQVRTIRAGSYLPFLKVVGTIATGPAEASAVMLAQPSG